MQSFITSFPFILTRSHSKCQMVNQKSFIIHNLLWILKYLYTNEHILRYNSVLDWCPMETHEQAILVGNRLFWFFVLCWAVLELLNNTRNGRLSILIWLIDLVVRWWLYKHKYKRFGIIITDAAYTDIIKWILSRASHQLPKSSIIGNRSFNIGRELMVRVHLFINEQFDEIAILM